MPVRAEHLQGIEEGGGNSGWGVVDGSFYIPFCWQDDTEASVTTKYVFNANCPGYLRVVNARCVLLGAGAASDTVQIQKISGGTTTNITDAIDLSVFSDTEIVDFSELNDANCDLKPGDSLIVTTASDALVRVEIELAWKVGGTV